MIFHSFGSFLLWWRRSWSWSWLASWQWWSATLSPLSSVIFTFFLIIFFTPVVGGSFIFVGIWVDAIMWAQDFLSTLRISLLLFIFLCILWVVLTWKRPTCTSLLSSSLRWTLLPFTYWWLSSSGQFIFLVRSLIISASWSNYNKIKINQMINHKYTYLIYYDLS